VLFFSSCWW